MSRLYDSFRPPTEMDMVIPTEEESLRGFRCRRVPGSQPSEGGLHCFIHRGVNYSLWYAKRRKNRFATRLINDQTAHEPRRPRNDDFYASCLESRTSGTTASHSGSASSNLYSTHDTYCLSLNTSFGSTNCCAQITVTGSSLKPRECLALTICNNYSR